MKYAKRILPFLLSLGILGMLVWIADPRLLWENLRRADPRWLSLVPLLYGITMLARSGRFLVLLRPTRVAPGGLLTVVLLHNGLNKVMPARSGELGFVYFLERRLGVPMARGVSVLLAVRLLDLGCVGVMFLGAAFLGPALPAESRGQLLAAGAVGTVGLIGGATALCLLGTRIAKRLRPLDQGGRLRRALVGGGIKGAEAFGQIDLVRGLAPAMLLSLALWGLLYGISFCVIRSVGADLSYAMVVTGATLAVLSNVVPIGAVGNFGPQEASWTVGFMLVGLSKELAVTSALLGNLAYTAVAVPLGGLGYLLMPGRRASRTAGPPLPDSPRSPPP